MKVEEAKKVRAQELCESRGGQKGQSSGGGVGGERETDR